jgi:UBX domain-containing protein 1
LFAIQQMSNINTFGSLAKKRESGSGAGRSGSGSSSEDEGQQAFYAGGSERSGQQVLGPPGKKKSANQLISDMFKSAREAGAQVLDRSTSEGELAARQQTAFSGTGYTLNSTAEGTSSGSPSSPGRASPERCLRKLKMWRNGFSIDEGELRNYNDPSNSEFLACIQRGEVPRELITEARGGEVNLNMEDHR